jgi:hypothetical protein
MKINTYTDIASVAPWPEGPWTPLLFETRRRIVNVVGNCRKIVNVVGNCQSCRQGGGDEDLKCCRPEIFFVLSETFFGLSEKHCPCLPPQKTWVPRRHCIACILSSPDTISSNLSAFRANLNSLFKVVLD